MDKRTRSRTLFHLLFRRVRFDASYGILKEYMLPIEIGGNRTIQLNPAEWIANRRTVELEKI